MNKKKKINILIIVLMLFAVITGLGKSVLAKGPHTFASTYSKDVYMRKDACLACHLVHGAKGPRQWSQPSGSGETTGVTLIQNLCMTCHYENDDNPDVEYDNGFYVSKLMYKAHVLQRAHGQHGKKYESSSVSRHGPGHLYKSNTITRYGDVVQGYLSMGYLTFESIAIAADPDSTDSDNLSILPRLSCTACHDPHSEYSSTYIDRDGALETYNDSAYNYIVEVVGDSTLSSTYYFETGSAIGRGRKICIACHGTSDILPDVVIDTLTAVHPPNSVADHNSASPSRCTGCHSWDWPAANCTSCHLYPPDSGAHYTHVYGETYVCQTCHNASNVHNNGTVNVVFDTTYSFPGGTFIEPNDTCYYTYESGRVPLDTSKAVYATCYVECHDPVIGGTDNDPVVIWPSVAIVVPEDYYSSFSCLVCHEVVGDIFTSTSPNKSSHPYINTSIVSERNSCQICHRDHNWVLFGGTHTHATNVYDWNPVAFDTAYATGFINPVAALYSSVVTTGFGFPSRFGSTSSMYNEGLNKVGFCDPCHDQTPFDIAYGTMMVHAGTTAVFDSGSATFYYSAPKAAAFFYESAVKNGANIGTTGIGGHGQSVTQVSLHSLGDSRSDTVFVKDENRIKCRSCHLYHGSTIPKILDTVAIRPSGVESKSGNPPLAVGNDNSLCYRCHFDDVFEYDNGFYSTTAYKLSAHGDTTDTSKFRIWDTTLPQKNYAPYSSINPAPRSYYWQTDQVTRDHKAGLCIYCHEPHGGYGWDVNVFDTPGFTGFTRAGTRGKYVDDDKYGTSVNLGDQTLCFKCHSLNATWNVYLETTWSSAGYAGKVYDVADWRLTGDSALDISDYFDTAKGSHHRVYGDEQAENGPLGNPDPLIIECINCHNPHKVIKDTTHDSVVTNLMYPFQPAEAMYDTTVTDSTLEYRVFNTFCLVCHDSDSETNLDSGNVYYDSLSDSLWGKLPRGIKFSYKDVWGEGDTSSPNDSTNFHSWNKAEYYTTYGHGIDSTLNIGVDTVTDRLPLARYPGSYGMSCASIDDFACHDPHGNTTNISLLKDNVQHPHDTSYSTWNAYNYSTPHIYDSTSTAMDDARNTDRWCAAACHQIGKRTGENDWTHVFTYVRQSEAPYDSGKYVFGTDAVLDIDIYDTGDTGTAEEPILDNTMDRNQDTACMWMHTSYNRVPGGDNNWTDKSNWDYDTNYKITLPAKFDPPGRRYVCFTCHDPHGTPNQAMIRYKFVDDTADADNSELCLKCHIFQ